MTAQENKISELRNAPLQPTGADNPYGNRYSVKDVIEHEMRLLENEKRNCEKTRAACEQAIRLIGTGKIFLMIAIMRGFLPLRLTDWSGK